MFPAFQQTYSRWAKTLGHRFAWWGGGIIIVLSQSFLDIPLWKYLRFGLSWLHVPGFWYERRKAQAVDQTQPLWEEQEESHCIGLCSSVAYWSPQTESLTSRTHGNTTEPGSDTCIHRPESWYPINACCPNRLSLHLRLDCLLTATARIDVQWLCLFTSALEPKRGTVCVTVLFWNRAVFNWRTWRDLDLLRL